jgi:hypothetical protein
MKRYTAPLLLALIPCFFKLVGAISVLHQFFPTLPIIWAQLASKHFLQNPRWFPFKIKKRMPSAPALEQDLPIVTNFDPP